MFENVLHWRDLTKFLRQKIKTKKSDVAYKLRPHDSFTWLSWKQWTMWKEKTMKHHLAPVAINQVGVIRDYAPKPNTHIWFSVDIVALKSQLWSWIVVTDCMTHKAKNTYLILYKSLLALLQAIKPKQTCIIVEEMILCLICALLSVSGESRIQCMSGL